MCHVVYYVTEFLVSVGITVASLALGLLDYDGYCSTYSIFTAE